MRIVYMHIAKTAGSFVNEYFKHALGEAACDTFVEHRLNSGETLAEILASRTFVSGHFFVGHLADIPKDGVIKFTIMRNPYEQIASNILWLDHYGAEEYRAELERLAPDAQELVRAVSATNLSDPRSLDHLLVNLSPFGIYQLNNLQTRYLIGDWDMKRRISLLDCAHAEKKSRRT